MDICKTCVNTGYYKCVCQLDGLMMWGCDECHNDTGFILCTDCDSILSVVFHAKIKDKQIADLQAENKTLRETILNEISEDVDND